jgi:hypothetical protein
MKRGFILIAVLLPVLLCGNVWAAEEVAIQELQTDVSDTKTKADKNAAEIESLKGGLPDLEKRVTDIENRLDFSPPVITHNAPTSTSNFDVEIIFTLSDDVELSHLIIQGDASPHIQLTQYFKPGVDYIEITHTFGLNTGSNEILAIAVDTEGNAAKNLIVIEQECCEFLDNDGDGYTVDEGDCDDNDPEVNPGASEVCDDIDNNCITGIDEGCDDDLDGYCDSARLIVGIPAVCLYGVGDCNDNISAVNPGAFEFCDDGIDDDCDGEVDEDCP